LNSVTVVWKDRLARFGYDMIEHILEKYSNAKIIILNKPTSKEPFEEITEDVMAIMNIYVVKINGMRKYKEIDLYVNLYVNITSYNYFIYPPF